MLFNLKKMISLLMASALSFILLNAAENIKLWEPPRKKVIEFGWDVPTPAYVRENIEMMEKNAPYDGIGIKIEVETEVNGKKLSCTRHTIFQDYKWNREWFKPVVNDLKNTKFNKFTDNFLLTTTLPGNVDWFDDKAWESICNNFSIMAWVAKEGGCKGLVFDIEDYQGKELFRFKNSGKHTFDETWNKARERGRQFMQAITKEYPDITLFAYYWLNLNYEIAASGNIPELLKSRTSGIVVPFINGIYDSLPPNAKIVDGTEHLGYRAKNLQDYLSLRNEFMAYSKLFILPENINKFMAQTSLAIPTYLDSYINDNNSNHVIKSDEMSRIDLFRRNVGMAVKYSDEYSWTWSEQAKWWPIKIPAWQEKSSLKKPGKGQLWELAFPGITAAIDYARNPAGYALSELEKGNLKNNLVKNPDFESGNSSGNNISPPPDCDTSKDLLGWLTWQKGTKDPKKNPQGTFALDKTTGYESSCSARLSMIKSGCIVQSIPVKPNEIYFIRASSLQKGNSNITMQIRWRNAENKWTSGHQNIIESFSEILKNGWKRASVCVTVPDNASSLTLLLSVTNNSTGGTEDVCWFDKVEVYKLF